MKENKLYKYKIEFEIITTDVIRGFQEPIFTSKFQILNRKIIECKEVEIIEKP